MVAVSSDLNVFGRTGVGLVRLIDNLRLNVVSVLIAVILTALLVAGIAGTAMTFVKVDEISAVWRAFDTGLARRLMLQSELRTHLGFGGLMQHFHDFVLTGDPLARQAVTTDIARLREIRPAYVVAGASAEEKAALDQVYRLIDAYDRAMPAVADAIARHENPGRAHALQGMDEAPAAAAIDRLAAHLKDEHKISADRVEDAAWMVSATVSGVMLLNGVLLLLLAVFIFWFTRYRIARPLGRLGGSMMSLSQGQTGIGVPFLDKTDEVGDMARAVEIFRDSMIRADSLEAQKRAAEAERHSRAQQREALTDAFGHSATRLLETVHNAVDEVHVVAENLSALAEETGRQAVAAAGASQQSSANVETVAAAAVELEATGHEISRGVGDSAAITREGVTAIDGLATTMGALDRAAARIGEIVTLINEIAAQTGLLALNASIEAQRAGNAGRGFAVVAGEVKTLARQTAHATEGIAEQIHGIQSITGEAVGALERVSEIIRRADKVVSGIAVAVEQQNSATRSIARNVHEAARGNQEVSCGVGEVSSAAESTGEMAVRMVDVIRILAEEARVMKTEVESFLSDVKAI
jgi:methyl-accepting chemotaxis protein